MEAQKRGNSSVRVRVYQPEDYAQVIKAFYEGMAFGRGSPADHSARAFYIHPFSCFVYLSGAISSWLIARSSYLSPSLRTLGILGAAGGVLCYLLWIPRRSKKMMAEYCEQCLREDLQDIAKHYRLEPSRPGSGSREYRPMGLSCFWVAETKSESGDGYEVVGCIGLDAESDSSSVAELRRLSVLPSQRGKGIGSLLMETLTAFAKEQKKLSSLRLTTSPFEPDGMRLYAKKGWKITETTAFKGPDMMSSQFYLVTMEYFNL